jgi:hypothetical protein
MPFFVLTWHLQNGSRLRRYVIPESRAVSLLSRDLRDAHLQALLGGGHSHRSSNPATTTTNIYADPLLSSFGLGFATSDAEEPSKSPVPVPDGTSKLKEAPPQPWESRYISWYHADCPTCFIPLWIILHMLPLQNLHSFCGKRVYILKIKAASYCVPNILVMIPTDYTSMHLEIISHLLLEISLPL